MAKLTWYAKGMEEALDGMSADPPMHPNHGSYQNYMAGYRDGERHLERAHTRGEDDDDDSE